MADPLEVRVARLEERDRAAAAVRADRDREIRDIKTAVNGMDAKLDLIVADKHQRDGAIGLGKWLFGTGVLAWIGGGVIWLLDALKDAAR